MKMAIMNHPDDRTQCYLVLVLKYLAFMGFVSIYLCIFDLLRFIYHLSLLFLRIVRLLLIRGSFCFVFCLPLTLSLLSLPYFWRF